MSADDPTPSPAETEPALPKVARVPLDKLVLDPNNPRIMGRVKPWPVPRERWADDDVQRNITNALQGPNADDLTDLLFSIAAIGWREANPIRVRPLDETRLLVIDGNRRVAALRWAQANNDEEIGKLPPSILKLRTVLALISDERPTPDDRIERALSHVHGIYPWSAENEASVFEELQSSFALDDEMLGNTFGLTEMMVQARVGARRLLASLVAEGRTQTIPESAHDVLARALERPSFQRWLDWRPGAAVCGNEQSWRRLCSWLMRTSRPTMGEGPNGREPRGRRWFKPLITTRSEVDEVARLLPSPARLDHWERQRRADVQRGDPDEQLLLAAEGAMLDVQDALNTFSAAWPVLTDKQRRELGRLTDTLRELFDARTSETQHQNTMLGSQVQPSVAPSAKTPLIDAPQAPESDVATAVVSVKARPIPSHDTLRTVSVGGVGRSVSHELVQLFFAAHHYLNSPEFHRMIEDASHAVQAAISLVAPIISAVHHADNAQIQQSPSWNPRFTGDQAHLSTLTVAQYRSITGLTLDGLGRINLIVGENNSGKTSVLEAISLLMHQSDPGEVLTALRRRARWDITRDAEWTSQELPAPVQVTAHLSGTPSRESSVTLTRSTEPPESAENRVMFLCSLANEARAGEHIQRSTIDIWAGREPKMQVHGERFWLGPTVFHSPFSSSDPETLQRANDLAIQLGVKDRLMQFLREEIDGDLRSIELVRDRRFRVSHNERKDSPDLSSFGDGLQRAFQIGLHLAAAAGGVLLIDELENALHTNLLIPFTRLIQELAVEFNVQVFISTHSKETVDAFLFNDYRNEDIVAYGLPAKGSEQPVKRYGGPGLRDVVEGLDLDIRRV
ncbi:AAA family ATPase [Myxococcota bacterium]|nr:AAA family ATPase [Myxococcota bacterium]